MESGSHEISTSAEVLPRLADELHEMLIQFIIWASIILSTTYWVGADSISALVGGGYGIRPYSSDQIMIKAII